MRGKGIAHAELAGELRRSRRSSPKSRSGGRLDLLGHDAHLGEGMALGKAAALEGEKLGHLLGKVLAAEGAQRRERLAVAAAGAADAEIDAAGMQRRRASDSVSATRSGTWLGSMTPPEPTRMRLVWAAALAMRMSGEDEAIEGMP